MAQSNQNQAPNDGESLYAIAHMHRGENCITHIHARTLGDAYARLLQINKRELGVVLAVGPSVGGFQDQQTGRIYI